MFITFGLALVRRADSNGQSIILNINDTQSQLIIRDEIRFYNNFVIISFLV